METATLSESKSAVPRIPIQEAKQRLDRGETLYFIDVRGHPDEYQIKGSVCYDPNVILSAEHVDLPVPREGPIITY